MVYDSHAVTAKVCLAYRLFAPVTNERIKYRSLIKGQIGAVAYIEWLFGGKAKVAYGLNMSADICGVLFEIGFSPSELTSGIVTRKYQIVK